MKHSAWISLTLVLTLSSAVLSDETDMVPIDNSRRKTDEMAQMYMAFMMFKTLLSSFMSLISPIIQIKSFGLSVIGTLINLARFLLMLRQSQQQQPQMQLQPQQQQQHPLLPAVMNGPGKMGWSGEGYKRVAYSQPPDVAEVSSYSPYYGYGYTSRASELAR